MIRSIVRSPTARRGALGGAAAAHQRADARQQLGERERLDEVVVGAAVETCDAVLQRVARGEHQDRRLHALAAQRRQDLQAIAPGQTQIQEDEIERLGRHPEEGVLAGTFDDDVVAFAFEPFAQGVGHFQFVFDDEHSHGWWLVVGG